MFTLNTLLALIFNHIIVIYGILIVQSTDFIDLTAAFEDVNLPFYNETYLF